MDTQKIYIFSGLGADERAFQNIDFSGLDIQHVKWLTPNNEESIRAYAKRLATQIIEKEPILIGLSFGGIMALEVAKHIAVKRIILLSSAKKKDEIPIYFRLAGKIRLHFLLPTALLKKANCVNFWLFGTSTLADKKLLKDILSDTDVTFLRWALQQIVRWDNESTPCPIAQLHGTKDRILPIRFVNDADLIDAGGHFMVLNRAKEVSVFIRKHL
ncbi:alpha/beta hydrolase [Sphingobacterium paludis]|uniref:Alpha/beta hydrolase family protein n=1 Tax=Sphingobacterium paludis TaxID=1476465 RepID=A0A4R7CV79_9SPHI|nr:alpha/beta hydrolase [Sphingobacterium paludis]TDS12309.1 alpha/beta hydrolase family protein [Sphingobacterium paludis]